MPLLYKTHFDYSKKNGKGIYASEPIPAGSIYWTLAPHPRQVAVEGQQIRQNKIYTKEEFQSQPDQNAKIEACTLSYYFAPGKVLISLFDGSYFFNHDPNGCSRTIFDGDLPKMHSIVTRDVQAGQQITENYSHWSVNQCEWLTQVMRKYSPERYQFETEYVAQKTSEKCQNENTITNLGIETEF